MVNPWIFFIFINFWINIVMKSTIYKFFKPLEEKERLSLDGSIKKLLKNKDFELYVRDLFNKAPPLQPDFLMRENYNSTSAALRAGEKNVSRTLLKIILESETPLFVENKEIPERKEFDFNNL
jgi:hypothetical protein